MTHPRTRQTQTDGRPWGPALRSEPPDPMLLSQWWSAPARSPIELLMLAVLEDAVRVVRGPDRDKDRWHAYHFGTPKEDALKWFHAEGDRYVFAFRTICDHFGYPVEAIRAALFEQERHPRMLRAYPRRNGRLRMEARA